MKEKLGKKVRAGAPVPAEKRMDLCKPMIYQAPFLMKTLAWPIANARKLISHSHITKINMDGLKAPFILVCNHNAFYDFYIMVAATKPFTGVYPAAVDDFIGREWFLRMGGCLPKRKYTSDLNTVRQCMRAIKDGESYGIFAEARYSLCGVTELDAVTDAVGQLVKLMGVPCVTFTSKGHHIYDPFWGNHKSRHMKRTEAVIEQIFTAEEVKNASVDEINAKIREHIYNDDWRWQSENRIRVTYKKRAEGLHKPLYMCPSCMTEYKMNSEGAVIYCEHCKKSWYLNEYGELEADCGETEFKYPSDWYLWEKEQVEREVREDRYHFECDCHVNDLPNSKGFVRLGRGKLVHDMDGFKLEGIRDCDGEKFEMKIDSAVQNSVHVEYSYRYGNGLDCIDLNTLKDTWYVFPEGCDFSVTKITFATEAIFKEVWRRKKEEKEKEKNDK
ncbi:MAG: 1-acyl-sn-glycerol-3-phosphate acyltransferase [Ruminococcaceae bacterium]|nr:1-acyl-sn-glycerol-3-phosphate acyltransferase [Oscillospiraceae bacterium]